MKKIIIILLISVSFAICQDRAKKFWTNSKEIYDIAIKIDKNREELLDYARTTLNYKDGVYALSITSLSLNSYQSTVFYSYSAFLYYDILLMNCQTANMAYRVTNSKNTLIGVVKSGWDSIKGQIKYFSSTSIKDRFYDGLKLHKKLIEELEKLEIPE